MIRRTSTRFLSLALVLALIACGGKDEENGSAAGSGRSGMSQHGGGESPGAMYALAGAASVETAEPDELGRLCPDGADVFVRIRNLDELVSEAGAIAASFGQEIPSVRDALGGQLGIPGLRGVDTKQPIGLALYLGAGMQPNFVLLLPVASKADFDAARSQGGSPFVATHVGNWAALATDPSLVEDLKVREEAPALAARALMGDLAISVNLASILEKNGGMVDGALGEVMPGQGELPPGASRSADAMEEAAKSFLADSDYLTLAIGLKNGILTLGARYGAKPGTDTAKFLATSEAAGKLLPRLGTDGFLTSAANVDGETMWKLLGPALADLEGMLPPDAMEAMREMIPLVEGSAATFGYANGITVTEILGLKDGERFEAALEATMPRLKALLLNAMEEEGVPEEVVQVDLDAGFEHEGTAVRGATLTVTLPDDPTQEEPKQMMSFFLGGPRFELWYARVDDQFVVTAGAGAKDRMGALLDRLKAGGDGPTGAAFDRATAGFPARPSSLFFVDFGQIAKIASKFPTEEMPPMLRQMLSRPPADLWVTGYYRMDDGTVDGGLRMSLKDLIEFGMPLFQGR